MPNSSTTSLKLNEEIKERVRRLASARRRSPHWLMCEAIKEYVEREERREQFREGALAAWAHYQTTGRHVAAEEADVWLAKLEAGKDAVPPKCHDRSGLNRPCWTWPGSMISWLQEPRLRQPG
jgi:predicted transcriptional regulator